VGVYLKVDGDGFGRHQSGRDGVWRAIYCSSPCVFQRKEGKRCGGFGKEVRSVTLNMNLDPRRIYSEAQIYR
jgi:hypothetical protein